MREKIPKIIMGLCLSLFVCLHFCLHAEHEYEDIVVTAVGEAAGTGLAAKEKSVEDALRNAVEKGFGVYIDSATLTENASLISDDVVAETRGFVRSFDILEQGEQDGIFTTKIRAEISMDKIWESDSLNLLLKRMGAPRFVIIASEDHEGAPAPKSSALQKVTELLVAKGFHLVNASNIDNLSPYEIKNALSNEGFAAEIGKKANAEIIVLVNASGAFESEKEVYNTTLKFFNGHCEIKAIQVDSRKIVASSVQSGKSGSIEEAIMAAAEDNAEKFIKQLLSAWSKYLNMGRSIEVVISNISVSELMRIVEKMKSLEGVRSVEQRKFSNRKAELEIKSKQKALYLAESIESLPDFKLEITSFSADKIVVRKK
jgi:hypothetical protein